MADKRNTGKSGKSESMDEQAKSEKNPDIGGLTASLEALVTIADEGEKRAAGDVVQLSSRSQKGRNGKDGEKKKSSRDKDKNSSNDKADISFNQRRGTRRCGAIGSG